QALRKLADLMGLFARGKRKDDPLAWPWDELTSAQATLTADIEAFGKEAAERGKAWTNAARDNFGLNAGRAALHPLADRCRDLKKQIDLSVKLS
ncbi:SAM-dependent DNA methyltransferase, partial [Rhizobium ruizarguesonis]